MEPRALDWGLALWERLRRHWRRFLEALVLCELWRRMWDPPPVRLRAGPLQAHGLVRLEGAGAHEASFFWRRAPECALPDFRALAARHSLPNPLLLAGQLVCRDSGEAVSFSLTLDLAGGRYSLSHEHRAAAGAGRVHAHPEKAILAGCADLGSLLAPIAGRRPCPEVEPIFGQAPAMPRRRLCS